MRERGKERDGALRVKPLPLGDCFACDRLDFVRQRSVSLQKQDRRVCVHTMFDFL